MSGCPYFEKRHLYVELSFVFFPLSLNEFSQAFLFLKLFFLLLLLFIFLLFIPQMSRTKWQMVFFFPFFFTCSSRLFKNKPPAEGEDDDPTQAGVNKASKGGIIYGDYLQVEHALQDLFSINLFLIYCSLHFCFLYSFFYLSAREDTVISGPAEWSEGKKDPRWAPFCRYPSR